MTLRQAFKVLRQSNIADCGLRDHRWKERTLCRALRRVARRGRKNSKAFHDDVRRELDALLFLLETTS